MPKTKPRSSPSFPLIPMFEVTSGVCLLQPKPRPLPIPASSTWLEVNEHSLFNNKRKAAKEIHGTLEEYYARTATQGSSTHQARFGLPGSTRLVEQMHQCKAQERDEAPSFSEAVKLSTLRDSLSAPARNFSNILKHGDKAEEDSLSKTSSKRTLPSESDSELGESSDTQHTFSTFVRQSGEMSRQPDAGIRSMSGYMYASDRNSTKSRREGMAAAATRGIDDTKTEAEIKERVSVDGDVEAQTKPCGHNHWQGVISAIRGMFHQ